VKFCEIFLGNLRFLHDDWDEVTFHSIQGVNELSKYIFGCELMNDLDLNRQDHLALLRLNCQGLNSSYDYLSEFSYNVQKMDVFG